VEAAAKYAAGLAKCYQAEVVQSDLPFAITRLTSWEPESERLPAEVRFAATQRATSEYSDGYRAGHLDQYMGAHASIIALTSRLHDYAEGYADGFYNNARKKVV